MISINFAGNNYRLIARVRTGLVTGTVLLALAGVAIVSVSFGLRSDRLGMNDKLKELEAAEEKVRPLLAERDRIIKDLASMSRLVESKKFSWTTLLTNIEAIVPPGVALAKVDFNARDHVLTLDGAAQSPESLRNLMIGLERSSCFKEPYLKHQSIDKGILSFNVVASYQEHKAAGMDQGK